MDASSQADRAAILEEVEGLLSVAFALEAWGRLLVMVERAGVTVRVNDLQVEEILDESAVERAFESDAAKAGIEALAHAVLALTMLEHLDLDDLGGGTFVRTEGGLSFLPGLVRTPSRSFDDRRDAVVAAMATKNAPLLERFGVGADAALESDMVTGALEVKRGGVTVARGSQVVIGSFSSSRRSWVWGAHNPSLDDAPRRRSAALLDAMRDRSMWEISTAGFVTDAATAWALGALVAEEQAMEGLAKVTTSQGFVLLGLSGLAPTAES